MIAAHYTRCPNCGQKVLCTQTHRLEMLLSGVAFWAFIISAELAIVIYAILRTWRM